MRIERKSLFDTFEHVAVIGGGVMALASSLALQRAGLKVILYDEGAAVPPASWGNAGHIAIEQVEPLASPHILRSAWRRFFFNGGPADFRLRDISVWLPWLIRFANACRPATFRSGARALEALLNDATPAWVRLVSAIGQPDLLKQNGHMVLWESEASATAGLAAWTRTPSGNTSFDSLEILPLSDPARTLPIEAAGGISFSGTSQIDDLGVLLQAMRRSFEDNGGEVRLSRVAGLSLDDGLARLTLADGEQVARCGVVMAAGVGSAPLMRSIGHIVPLIAERGYHIEGDAGSWPEHLPPVVFEDRSMIVTRFGKRLRAASFTEFARPSSPPDEKKWLRLRRHVAELGLPLGEPVTQWMGARPTFPDYLPALGVSNRCSNLIYAFGHQHLGLTLAPVTAEIVAGLAMNLTPEIDLLPFDIERFRSRNKGTL